MGCLFLGEGINLLEGKIPLSSGLFHPPAYSCKPANLPTSKGDRSERGYAEGIMKTKNVWKQRVGEDGLDASFWGTDPPPMVYSSLVGRFKIPL